MTILESLMTVGCLVRFGQQHGVVDSFNKRTNEVTIRVAGDTFPTVHVAHFSMVRAGNDVSEEIVVGVVTKQYPKHPWPRVGNEARTLKHPRIPEMWR